LAREIGSRTAPGQGGFSSQSFKVGAVSELSAAGAGPSAVAAFTGHKTASALMHYNRKRMNCEVPTLMAVTADGANYTREDASLEWASSSVNVATHQGITKRGRPRKITTHASTLHTPAPVRQGPTTAMMVTPVTPAPQLAPGAATGTPRPNGGKRVTPVLVSSSLPMRDQANGHFTQRDPLRAVQERLMNLGRRIKRAEQAEARQNVAFGGATTLRDDPPATFEEEFGAAFAADLRKPTADLNEEAEVDDDITVSSDESEAGISVATEGSERSDPITEWTAQSSEAQPDIPPARFGKWVKTPAGKESQGGTGGDQATGGILPTRGHG